MTTKTKTLLVKVYMYLLYVFTMCNYYMYLLCVFIICILSKKKRYRQVKKVKLNETDTIIKSHFEEAF